MRPTTTLTTPTRPEAIAPRGASAVFRPPPRNSLDLHANQHSCHRRSAYHRITRSRSPHYVKQGKEGYPQAWKTLELVSFACLTKPHFHFADTTIKKEIARSCGDPQHETLESWMKAVNAPRNLFYGTKTEILIQEKIMLYWYFFEHGQLPPGNKIFK